MILDTNAISAIADNQSAAVRLFNDSATVELPAIVVGEYRFGIAQSRRSKEYEKWLEELIAATRFLPVDQETTRYYAQVRSDLKKSGKPIPSNDLWIAALCRQHRLPLMSEDRHFDAVAGLKRIGW